MHHYSQGRHTVQGHKGIPDGAFEEEQGRKGFYGPVSHLIKPEPSTRWNAIEGPLRPHLFDLVKMSHHWGYWQRTVSNNDVAVYNYWEKRSEQAPKGGFRNADGETLYFCHKGSGEIFTEFGLLKFRKGSYVLIPKCVTHTFYFAEETNFLVIESRNSIYREPDRGMVGRNAFYDTEALGKPDLDLMNERKSQLGLKVTQILVKRLDQGTKFSYDNCYYDTLGWKGDFFPITLHIDDLMPLVSARVHLPPSAHTTFVANGFVVCTFLPRPLETDPDALKVPFYHQNIDYDEVLFYHDGNFFSRDNLHAGMMTLHPAGFPHGPHPKAVAGVGAKTHTDEVAVMIDSWAPFNIDPEFAKVELPEYWASWKMK
jgi:homogentisate 1,2-dioxygenase